MLISYWDCIYGEYDGEVFNEDGDGCHIYLCRHPKGKSYCSLDNKYRDQKAKCRLAKAKEASNDIVC